MSERTPPRRFETLAVHAGRRVDPATGAVAPPIHPSTTFERDADGGYARGHVYSRRSNPTRQALEACLAELEGADEALAFASGSAATAAVLQSLHPGDHVLLSRDAYHGTRHQLEALAARWQISHDRVDTSDAAAVARAVRPETRLLWIESPSNPRLLLSDLEALAALAREHGILSVCDSTLATPLFQRPLAHGIDLVMHSSTKYLGGHSDLLGGVLVPRKALAQTELLREIQTSAGAVPSAFDAWLLLRSLSSLAVRVGAQARSAEVLAQRLTEHSAVEAVYHPSLEQGEMAERYRRQMSGGPAVVSFCVVGGQAPAMRVAAGTRLITRATSLGGVESLIEHRASVEGPGSLTPPGLLRLSIGLEHAEDLWDDLQSALSAVA
jgi:cystathionine gamma-synthase